MIAAAALAAALAAACPPQAEVLDAAAARIEAAYVPAAEAPQIASDLRAWAKANRYAADCASPTRFAERLTEDLKARDQHLQVELAGSGAEDKDWIARWRAEAVAANAGVRDVALLSGGVGYLRLSSFYSWDLARPKLAAAFALLDGARAMVLDLRRNGGGDGETAGYVLATFLPGPDRILRLEKRTGLENEGPLPAPPWPRLTGVPLVVLVDRRSGSASEAVAFTLQAAGRARVVGDRTIGAANLLGDSFALPHGFLLWAPEARPVNPKTGANWERIGVKPDVPGDDDPLHTSRRLLEQDLERKAGEVIDDPS